MLGRTCSVVGHVCKAYLGGWQCQRQDVEGGMLTDKAMLTGDAQHIIHRVAFQGQPTGAPA